MAERWKNTKRAKPVKDRNILLCSNTGKVSTGYLCLATGKYRPDCGDLQSDLYHGDYIAYWQEIKLPKKLQK